MPKIPQPIRFLQLQLGGGTTIKSISIKVVVNIKYIRASKGWQNLLFTLDFRRYSQTRLVLIADTPTL